MISVISDIHIKKVGDGPYNLFLSFLNHPKVSSSEYVILLGDIFDLLVGGDRSFLKEFEEVFVGIKKLLSLGVKVKYIEGNHDFHLESFFKKNLCHENFEHCPEAIFLELRGKNYFFCHGDDIELDNLSYKTYSAIIRSQPVKILAEHIIPFFVTRKIGEWASGRSRKKNIEKYNTQSLEVRDKFRRSAMATCLNLKDISYIISGHSHIKDLVDLGGGTIYLNNGFAPTEKTFIFIDEEASFINLTETSL